MLGLALTLVHGLVLLADHYIGFTPVGLAVPFASGYEPFWMGLGQMAFYFAAVASLSFYVKRRIGQRIWRLLHYSTFVVFALALVKGIASGSDTTKMPMVAWYIFSGLTTAGLIWYRITTARANRATER